MKVKHRNKPAEPFATVGAHGVVTRTFEDGPLRITPAHRQIPAMAHVQWDSPNDATGPYFTWERLADLIELGKGR